MPLYPNSGFSVVKSTERFLIWGCSEQAILLLKISWTLENKCHISILALKNLHHMDEIDFIFFLQFPSSPFFFFCWCYSTLQTNSLYPVALLICFRIPKTFSSSWTCPLLNFWYECYPSSSLFFTSTYFMTSFLIILSTQKNFLASYSHSLLLITEFRIFYIIS